MKRKALKQFFEWKLRQGRKPLIVYGARQVGKTWLMQEFARQAYSNSVYVNFEDEDRLSTLFERDFNIDRILATISVVTGRTITQDTLLILDEIQAVKRGVTSLKYFCEKAPWLHIVAAGSLLGVSLHKGDSFPVGKVDSIHLAPLDFEEFLHATGREQMATLVRDRQWDTVDGVHDMYKNALKEYYYVGGMPAVVESFRTSHDYDEVRRLQLEIIDNYERDFSKHAPANEVPRIRLVWHSLYGQLARENRKFIYGALKEGGRAREFEMAIQWLVDAGLVGKVYRTKNVELPLSAFEDISSFKLYALDVGLLAAMGRLSATTLIDGNEIFLTAKGALTEQYVHQQLAAAGVPDTYWSAENARAEVDFLVQLNDTIVPIEVKAEENLKAKSLRTFIASHPHLHAWRLSMSPHRKQDWLTCYPLYALPAIL